MGYGDVRAWWEEEDYGNLSFDEKDEFQDSLHKNPERDRILKNLKKLHAELAKVPLPQGEGISLTQHLWMNINMMEKNTKRNEEWNTSARKAERDARPKKRKGDKLI